MNKRKIEYYIAKEYDEDVLSVEVQKLLRKGWRLHGAPFSHVECLQDELNPAVVAFCQALTLGYDQ